MVTRRCSECRRRFTPVVSAVGHQLVCGVACRSRRSNRLARRRRRDDLDEHQADERARQQRRRDAVRAAGCHAQASVHNSPDLLGKVQQIVDKVASLSRATLRRDLARILREIGPKMDKTDGRHALPSALGAREMGSRSALDVDGVTGGSGAS
jgi:hypothetical protein